MSTEIKCDGCGCKLATVQRPNYWHAAFMGDTLRGPDGNVLDITGLTAPGNHPYIVRLLEADMCIPCMAKTQEETT